MVLQQTLEFAKQSRQLAALLVPVVKVCALHVVLLPHAAAGAENCSLWSSGNF